jgi:hypothetical protein
MSWAEAVIDASSWPLDQNLVPILALDEKSFACVVLSNSAGPNLRGENAVVRWHLDVRNEALQGAVLDTDVLRYAESVAEELEAREAGMERVLREIGPAYELQYLDANKRPRDFVLRPVRLACQNVIVALAAFAHDSAIDGMSVVAWQTCEVPHVATHEANRALSALMLCDAFASGGTMEIRFDRTIKLSAHGISARTGDAVDIEATYIGHPEHGRVPASLRRFGRTALVELGAEDQHAISPSEARELFLAVTPMPDDLSNRVRTAWRSGVATPERLCYTLLAQIWREVELDYMLACSPRTGSIISGGADWDSRGARQAESQIARTALMVGMFYRRLDTLDGAGAIGTDARAIEDNRVGVTWEVSPEFGAITFHGLRAEPVPWQAPTEVEVGQILCDESLTVLPRLLADEQTLRTASSIWSDSGVQVAVVIPRDSAGDGESAAARGVLLLRCPDRLGELDQVIESKLLSARIARA